MCRNSNLTVHRKNVKKILLSNWFFVFFWTLTKKTCVFTGKFLAMFSKLLSTCPEENLQSNISQRKSWKLQDFRINFEVFGTMAEKFFRVGKTAKYVQGNSFWKKFFKNRKIRFFPILSVFLLLAKTFARFAKHAIWPCVEVMGEKHCFNYIYSFTLLWTLIQKTLSRKVFSWVVTTAIRAFRGTFWLKVIFLGKVIFVHPFWSWSIFFCLLTKKKLVCQRNNLLIQKKNGGNNL